MGFASDFVEEYKKLPKGGKIAVGGIAVLVAGIGFYEYRKKASGQTASGVAGTPAGVNTSGGVGNLSALDTQSLAQMIAGFVNAGQSVNNGTGTSNTNGNPTNTNPKIPIPTTTGYYSVDPNTNAPIFPTSGGVVPGNIQPPSGGIGPAIIKAKSTPVPTSRISFVSNGPQFSPVTPVLSGYSTPSPQGGKGNTNVPTADGRPIRGGPF